MSKYSDRCKSTVILIIKTATFLAAFAALGLDIDIHFELKKFKTKSDEQVSGLET